MKVKLLSILISHLDVAMTIEQILVGEGGFVWEMIVLSKNF